MWTWFLFVVGSFLAEPLTERVHKCIFITLMCTKWSNCKKTNKTKKYLGGWCVHTVEVWGICIFIFYLRNKSLVSKLFHYYYFYIQISFICSSSVNVEVDLKPILRTLCVRWEYTLDGPYIHTRVTEKDVFVLGGKKPPNHRENVQALHTQVRGEI